MDFLRSCHVEVHQHDESESVFDLDAYNQESHHGAVNIWGHGVRATQRIKSS